MSNVPNVNFNKIPNNGVQFNQKQYYEDNFDKINDELVSNVNAQLNDTAQRIDNIITTPVPTGEAVAQEIIDARDPGKSIGATIRDRDKKNADKIESASIANSVYPLHIPTYDNGNQAIHPKVIDMGAAWNGWRYWMAYTPYTGGNDLYENPCIAVSNDLIRWQAPTGLTNPLQAVPNPNNGWHYSDTHLLYRTDLNRLEIWYRYNKNGVEEKIYRQTSLNGVTWSEKELALDYGTGTTEMCYSPAVIFENGKYRMWYVGIDLKLWHMESADGLTWTNKTSRHVPFEGDYRLWHIDIEKTELGYEALWNGYPYGQTEKRILFYAKSTDGLVFDVAKPIIKPSANSKAWDNSQIYRSSLLKVNGNYYVFYSALGINPLTGTNIWGTGLASGIDPINLKGYDNVLGQGDVDLKYISSIIRAFLQKPYLFDAVLQTDLHGGARFITDLYGIKGRTTHPLIIQPQNGQLLQLNYNNTGDIYFYKGINADVRYANGEFEFLSGGKGFILKSNAGTRYRITVNNLGEIVATPIV